MDQRAEQLYREVQLIFARAGADLPPDDYREFLEECADAIAERINELMAVNTD